MPTPSHLGKVLKIFYSYDRHDELLRADLARHLSGLRRQGLIAGWYSGEIEAGGEREKLLKKNLDQADLILLLISPDFIASDNCYCIEMTLAMERHKRGEAYVMPVLLRPTEFQGLPFAFLQYVPADGTFIATRLDRDVALLEVVDAIKGIIAAISAKLPSEPVPSESAGKQPVWWKVPYPRNPFFTGRVSVLEQLHAAFLARQASVFMQSLNGLGGIGKTQIMLEYAYRYAGAYEAIFWVAADPQGDLLADFVTIAQFIDLPEKNEADQALVVVALKRWFQQHAGWLLLFDNVEDMAAVKALLPTAGKGHIVITTRAQAVGNRATPREVEPLDLADGTQFLLLRAKLLAQDRPSEQVESQQREAAQELTHLFAGHPLALDQAGAYLEETGLSLVEYLDLYQRRQAALLGRRGDASMDHPESVTATFLLALERIERARPAAVELLRFSAFLHSDALPEEILMAGATYFEPASQAIAHDAFELGEVFAVLRKYSLIRRNAATKTISVHRLVQDVLKNGMDQEQQRHWAESAVRILGSKFPSGEPDSWSLCQRYLSHARVCMQLIEAWQMRFVEAALLLKHVGSYLYQRSEYAEAQLRFEQALDLLVEEEEPLLTAQVLSKLGVLHLIRANYQQADHYLRRALSVHERVLEPAHPDLAQNLNDLAGVQHNQGAYAQAEPLYQRALAIQEQTLGAENPATARTLNNLALLAYNLAKYPEAEALNKRALAAREKLGAKNVETGQSVLNLAHVYRMQQRYAEAEPLFARALAIYEDVYGPEHAQTGIALNGCALLSKAQQQYDQAEPLFRRALAIWEKTLGPEHPRNVGALNALAMLVLSQGNYREAEQLLRRALHIQEQTSWLEYSDLVPAFRELADAYEKQQNHAQAESLYRLIIAIQQRVSGAEHPDVLAAQEEYAAFLRRTPSADDASESNKELN
ncbi:MAG TPA: FxSxx-COOH system tetratricopeptide repeat protein [Ktedonobacteraceae bacterium]|nr:FxSxx-COOH system tetratricopeptide repeat protein [Ktedonobacteraceae bacterium]